MAVKNMLESVPFRFLDLPKELRYMIYENLTISTKQIRLLPLEDGLQIDQQTTELCLDQPAITVTLQTLPVQISTTCRTIYSEALPFITRKLEKIHDTIPKLSIDSDCLYTHALASTQTLLRALLHNLNQHSFFDPKPGCASSRPKKQNSGLQYYPPQVQHWLAQTAHLLLSQRPAPCPFAGFMGARSYPTVRLVIEVPKVWRYTAYRGLVAGSHTRVGTPPMYTASVSTQLTEIWNDLASCTKGLKHVKSGAIVFGQDDERMVMKDGLIVKKTVALDFGICRVAE